MRNRTEVAACVHRSTARSRAMRGAHLGAVTRGVLEFTGISMLVVPMPA